MIATKIPCQARKLGGTCKADLYWLNSAVTGKSAPIDAEPTDAEKGTIMVDLEARTYAIVKDRDTREELASHGVQFHTNHFGTCPDSELFRSKKAVADRSS